MPGVSPQGTVGELIGVTVLAILIGLEALVGDASSRDWLDPWLLAGCVFGSLALRVFVRQQRAGARSPLWRDLIEANRSLLVDPDNADLLFPGQTLRLPRPRGEGGSTPRWP